MKNRSNIKAANERLSQCLFCQIIKNMTNADFAESIRQKIWDNQTFTDYRHYGDFYSNSSRQGTTHLSIIAENGDAVSATTTINYL